MAINFPTTVGQATDGSYTHIEAGIGYKWDGDSWNAIGGNLTPITDLTAFSVTTNSAGSASLSYNNGVFTYTPPDLSGFAANTNVANWDDAYSWGDHALVGYATITALNSGIANAGNWDTAYGWGDHAQAGYSTNNYSQQLVGGSTAVQLNFLSTPASGGAPGTTSIVMNAGNNISFSNVSSAGFTIDSSGGGSSGGASVTVSDTAPGSGTAGDLWWNSDSGRLKIYYQDTDSTQWVDASPPRSFSDSQVQSDWAETDSNNVAFIENKPTIPAAQVNSDWNAVSGVEQILNKPTLFSGSYNDLTNQPTLFSGSYNDLSNKPTIPDPGIVSVKDYGAVGDGSTDDTSAIQSALSSNVKAIYFPTGDYRITSSLTSSLDGRKIYGEGSITATADVDKAIIFNFSDYVELSLNCKGNNNIRVFAQFNSCLDPYIHHCRVRDLQSPNNGTGGKAIAFELFNGKNPNGSDNTSLAVDTGVKITDNYITNLNAYGDGSYNDGNGMARAIAFDSSVAMTKPILISDNVIDTVIGEEGDAISIMSATGGSYFTANVFITGNHIRNFNRRGVKIKFNSAVVSNNTFYNTWTSSPTAPQAVIDMDRGEKHIISGNKFINTEYMQQIKIQVNTSDGDEKVNNVVINNNIITRIGSGTSNTLIYVKPSTQGDKGTNITIKGNSFDVPGYSSQCIQVNRAKNVIVADNTGITSSGATGVNLVSVDNSIDNNNNFLVAT